MPKLTERNVQTAKAGRYGDGSNLYLDVSDAGAKRWTIIYKFGTKRREMALGKYPEISLAKARVLAFEARQQIAAGVDPLEARKAQKAKADGVTFQGFADKWLEGKEAGFRNAKHFLQWKMTLREYAKPLHALPIAEVKTAHVLAVLQPIWLTIPETASRLRGRIEMILNAAQSLGLIAENVPNPARWRGHLQNLLPAQPKRQEHHAALDYKDVAAFMADLRSRAATAALALEFAILCGGRTGEVIGAQWTEIDFENALWTVPPERMKRGKAHVVPLSRRALEILQALEKVKVSDFVFVAQRDQPVSNMALTMLLRRMGRNGAEAKKAGRHCTVHGFRSTFRDWCGDVAGVPREIAEAALSHTVGSKVEAAYRRSTALEARRVLMQSWCDYCDSQAGSVGNVVQLRA